MHPGTIHPACLTADALDTRPKQCRNGLPASWRTQTLPVRTRSKVSLRPSLAAPLPVRSAGSRSPGVLDAHRRRTWTG